MIEYICDHCNGLTSETSTCPSCGQRARQNKSVIYWSFSKNTPSFDETILETGEVCKPVGNDIRPVFPMERLIIEILLGEPFKYCEASVWNAGGNKYIFNGEQKILQLNKLKAKYPPEVMRQKLQELQKENEKYVENYLQSDPIRNFIELNSGRLSRITAEASAFIQESTKGFEPDEMFVSFSGGKDSTVTSDLAMKALNMKGLIHIYGDTTLEYPATAQYMAEFKMQNPGTPVLKAKNNDQDFQDLCEVIGPPSRVIRWCCTVFKTGAITKVIDTAFKYKSRIVSFQGIRRNESKSRSKYDRITGNSKIAKQLVLAPIIDWLDFDVWLYILSNQLPFNPAYMQGFSRVGCWCCPNNTDWNAYLSALYMPEEYEKWMSLLYRFARKVGKSDWKDYVDEGKWKARQGGNGLEISGNVSVSFTPCATEENAYNFSLTRPIDDTLFTLFKPFGKMDTAIGNARLGEVYYMDRNTGEPVLKISGKKGKNKLKITVLKKSIRNVKITESLLKAQITKFQNCLACSGCASVCRFDALRVMNTNKGNVSTDSVSYTIDSDKCVGCLKCVNHFDGGCYMYKVLKTKKGQTA